MFIFFILQLMSISSVPYSLVCVLRMNPTVCQFHWFWRFWAFGHFLLACSSFNVNLFVHEILKTYIHTYVYIYVTNTGNWKLYSADSLWRSGVYWVNMYVAKKKGLLFIGESTYSSQTNEWKHIRTYRMDAYIHNYHIFTFDWNSLPYSGV